MEPKGSFNEPDCCVDCKVDTPHKYHSCDYPCSKYRYERAVQAGLQFSAEARRSAEDIKQHPLEDDC